MRQYKRFQTYRNNGRIGICECDPRTGRFIRSVADVLDGFEGNMLRVGAALDEANKRRKCSYAPFLNEAIDALNNRP